VALLTLPACFPARHQPAALLPCCPAAPHNTTAAAQSLTITPVSLTLQAADPAILATLNDPKLAATVFAPTGASFAPAQPRAWLVGGGGPTES